MVRPCSFEEEGRICLCPISFHYRKLDEENFAYKKNIYLGPGSKINVRIDGSEKEIIK